MKQRVSRSGSRPFLLPVPRTFYQHSLIKRLTDTIQRPLHLDSLSCLNDPRISSQTKISASHSHTRRYYVADFLPAQSGDPL